MELRDDETAGKEWQVIVMESFYPSVFMFATYAEAVEKYDVLQVDPCYDDRLVTISEVVDRKGRFYEHEVEWAYN